MAGLTPQGYQIKRLNDVLTDAASSLSTITDPVSGESLQPDFSSNDPAMQVVQVPLEGVGEAWQISQVAYGQFNPSIASSAALSGLVQLNGIERDLDVASTVILTLTGTPGVTITGPRTVSDANDVNQWTISSDFTFGSGGTVSVTATCTVTGPISASANTITRIVTPSGGWTAVNNASSATVGRNEETDIELRNRRRNSTLAPASGPAEAVFSNLLNVSGVTYARVYINNTMTTDSRGIPAKNQACVIVGGNDQDIASTILARSGAGVEFFGTTSFTLTDLQGEPYTIKWTRPTEIPIFVAINITTDDSYPDTGANDIRQAIIDYARSGAIALGIEDGFRDTGFQPGSSVVHSRLFTPINSVAGHTVNSLFIGTSANPTATSDISVQFDQIASFSAANITITEA